MNATNQGARRAQAGPRWAHGGGEEQKTCNKMEGKSKKSAKNVGSAKGGCPGGGGLGGDIHEEINTPFTLQARCSGFPVLRTFRRGTY